MNICAWKYKHYPYIINIKHYGDIPDEHIIFNGDKPLTDILIYKSDINDKYIISDNYIEEDDNILQILNKISILLKVKPTDIFMYANNTGVNNVTTSLNHYYYTKSGRPLILKNLDFTYNIFDYNLKTINKVTLELYTPLNTTNKTINILSNPGQLNRVNTESHLLNTFYLNKPESQEYYNNINIILYPELHKIITKSKSINYETQKQFLNLYYPDHTDEVIDYENISTIITRDKKLINTIYSVDDKEVDELITTSPCNISEVVIHINYENNAGIEYIDQNKIFNRYRLSHETPFVKYKTENTGVAQYHAHRDLTKEDSEIYMPMEDLESWIHTKAKYKADNERVIMVGKGLSYKVFLYNYKNISTGKSERIYMTFNIFKTGKLEIKCAWKSSNAGKFEYIIESIVKVRDIIREINKIDYQVVGKSRKIKIPEPDPEFYTKKYSNTKIAFYSILYDINLKKSMSLQDYNKNIEKYVTFITQTDDVIDTSSRTISLRYKRTNAYLKDESINRFIHKLHNDDMPKNDIVGELEKKFSFTQETAKAKLYNYMEIISRKKIKTDVIIPDDDEDDPELKNNKLADFELFENKETGVSITIKKENSKNYAIRLLGPSHYNLGQIFYFIKNSMYLFMTSHKAIIPDISKKETISKFGIKKGNLLGDSSEDEESSDEDESDKSDNEEDIIDAVDINANASVSVSVSSKSDIETNEYTTKEEPKNTDSLLKRLKFSNEKLFYHDKYKKNSYSRKCQQDIKKPLVITSRKAGELLVKQQKLLAKTKDPLEKKEIAKNIAILTESGHHIKGYYYFCPDKWDGNTYEPVSADSTNIIDKSKFTKIIFANSVCQPCCVTKQISSKHKDLEKKCMNKFTGVKDSSDDGHNNKIITNVNKYYILESAKRYADIADRYIALPNLLNDIFNNKTQCKNQIGPDVSYSCILRKSVAGPNYFLNALASAINRNVSYIFDNIKLALSGRIINGIPVKGTNIFRTLKNGALYNIFMPENVDRRASKVLSKLALNEFLTFIQHNLNTINEKFLWDLVSLPGVLTKNGVNLFIIEGKYAVTNLLMSVDIKCPVGYNIKTLFDKSKESIILYKYETCYELICTANYSNKKIISEAIFAKNNKYTDKFLKSIKLCAAVIDNVARDEFKLFINNVTHATIIDRLYDLDNIIYDLDKISESISRMIVKYDGLFDDYAIKAQIVDSYNKVRYLILNNNLIIPIYPSQIDLKYEIKFSIDYSPLSYNDTIFKLLILEKYAILPKYHPYSFLIDPGHSITDIADDSVVGILLRNGMTISIIPQPIIELEYKIITVNRPAQYEPIVFNSNKLLFRINERIDEIDIKDKDIKSQYKYYSEAKVDKLLQYDKKINDKRKIFTTRLNFEEESYERLRYELSKYLQKNETYIALLKEIINNDAKIKHKRNDLEKIMNLIFTEITMCTSDLSEKERHLFEQLVGPLHAGFADIEDDENLKNYAFSYVKPIFRQECMTTNEANNVHCVKQKLFISTINLNNGNTENLYNYKKRIIEELLRNSIKRAEIFDDQINNAFDVIPYIETEYHIMINDSDTTVTEGVKIADLKKQITNLYNKNITYDDKNNSHYDILNPEGAKITDENTDANDYDSKNICAGEYVLLPEYWLNKLKKTNYQYLKTNHNSCIFSLIKKAIESRNGNNKLNDLKNYIVDSLSKTQELKQEKGKKIILWEAIKEAYALLDVMFDVETEEEFYEAIKSYDHQLNIYDLSIISRLLDVKFIILCDPDENFPSGIRCLETTQTLADNYILLFSTKFNDFSIIHDINNIIPINNFTEDMLKDELIIESWKAQCSLDYKDYIEKFNQLFYNINAIKAVYVDDDESHPSFSLKEISFESNASSAESETSEDESSDGKYNIDYLSE